MHVAAAADKVVGGCSPPRQQACVHTLGDLNMQRLSTDCSILVRHQAIAGPNSYGALDETQGRCDLASVCSCMAEACCPAPPRTQFSNNLQTQFSKSHSLTFCQTLSASQEAPQPAFQLPNRSKNALVSCWVKLDTSSWYAVMHPPWASLLIRTLL